ncbi:MAG: hypothetical protein ACXWWC_01770 [Chitinophagaceae bacterium]
MEDWNQNINNFFNQYEAKFNEALGGSPKTEETAGAFADYFIAANPSGVTCGKNDEQFRKAISQGYEFYKGNGLRAMKIISQNNSSLDEFHALNKVQWKSFYETKQGKKVEIEFNVIYFLQLLNKQVKIFGYITGDEQKLLQERGLVTH